MKVMGKIIFAKRNHMNVWILTLISIVFLSAAGLYFLNYAFAMTGLDLNILTAFASPTMTVALGVFVFGLFSVISLWKSWNRFYTPIWLIMSFGLCYFLFGHWNGPANNIYKDVIFMMIFSVLTIAYYLWCQKSARADYEH